MFFILLAASVFGFAVEFARLKNASRRYFFYETRVETELVARLAERFLRQNDRIGFERFCRESGHYHRKTASEQKTRTEDRPFDLFSRVTLFDSGGRVLFDSWQNASAMENHKERPEFVEISHQDEKTPFPVVTFERYSTTLQTKMVFCITRFPVEGDVYLLRLGNTLEAIQAADGVYRRNLLYVFLFTAAIVALLLISFVSQILHYRRKLLALKHECADGISDSSLDENRAIGSKTRIPSIDFLLRSIKGEFDTRTGLLTRERQLREMIFQSLLEGVILTDSEGNLLDINENACRLLGTQTRRVQKRSLFALCRNTELETLFHQCGTEPLSDSVRAEIAFELPDGTRRCDIQIRVIPGEKSAATRLLLLYDLTKTRKLEQYRREFLSHVSHELKTPLTVIMGTVEALADGALEDRQQTLSFLATLSTHSRRLYTLVQDVLTLSHLESDVVERQKAMPTGSFGAVAASAMALSEQFAAQKGVLLTMEDTSEQDRLPLDFGLMEQAILNLIDNAVNYSSEDNGAPETEPGDHQTTNAKKPVTLRLSNPDPKTLRFDVADEGPGIAPEHQLRIFERFYRVDPSRSRRTGGTGLGLAIVKHIVQLHGGSVSVQNRPVRGCTFTILLPLSTDAPPV